LRSDRDRENDIRVLVREYGRHHGFSWDDPFYGEAFVYYTLFSDFELVERVGLFDMDEKGCLYNEFFWLSLFAALHMSRHGRDVGLEQQKFQIMERADHCEDIDWNVIADILDFAEVKAHDSCNPMD
jgi:hypothetical protein